MPSTEEKTVTKLAEKTPCGDNPTKTQGESPICAKSKEDAEREEAEKAFREMMDGENAFESLVKDIPEDNDEVNVATITDKFVTKQELELMEEQRILDAEAKDAEIEALRDELAQAQLESDETKMQKALEEQQRLYQLAAMEAELQRAKEAMTPAKQDPLTTNFQFQYGDYMVDTTKFTVHYNPGRPLGLAIKRFSKKFMVVGITGGQSEAYNGIERGLLIHKIVTWTPGATTGTSLRCQTESEIVNKIFAAFGEGKNVTVEFLLPPQGFSNDSIPDHVYVAPAPQMRYVQSAPQTRYVQSRPYY